MGMDFLRRNFSFLKKMDEADIEGFQEEEEQGLDDVFLNPNERRYALYEPKYQCKSDERYGLQADTSPDARLYCLMVAFIETRKFNSDEQKTWYGMANTIIDMIKGTRYVKYVNGPCLLISLYLRDSKNLKQDMKKFLITKKSEGVRSERDIYRYIRFWEKMLKQKSPKREVIKHSPVRRIIEDEEDDMGFDY
jgi:hypothetical protein